MKKNAKIILLGVIIVLAVGGLFLFFGKDKASAPQETTQTKTNPFLEKLSQGYKDATWTNPAQTNEATGPYGEMLGEKITTETTVDKPLVEHFEDKNYLESLGYKEDLGMAADGPGSSVWGYSRTENGNTKVVIFSYNVKPTDNNPNEPVQFNCPCQATLSIFAN